MARSKQSLSETEIASRIKKGRGQGQSKSYKPWLYVQDVPSDGRSHRVYSHKTGRVHHLLSDLELAAFLTFDWQPQTIDIREQFPIRRDESREIAEHSEIKHPNVRGIDQVMSSDFLIDTNNVLAPQFVVQVKSLSMMNDLRTMEKLELERRYWDSKQIPWVIFTENEIDPVMKQNMEWLFPVKTDEEIDQQLLIQLPIFAAMFRKHQNLKMVDICKLLDLAYELEVGKSLRDFRILLANGLIRINVHKCFRDCKGEEFIFSDMNEAEAALYVAN
jgi:hypothetical protein